MPPSPPAANVETASAEAARVAVTALIDVRDVAAETEGIITPTRERIVDLTTAAQDEMEGMIGYVTMTTIDDAGTIGEETFLEDHISETNETIATTTVDLLLRLRQDLLISP
jgi:hypothetical protein